MRKLSKTKKEVFKKEGRSIKYKELVKEFNTARKKAISKYLDKTITTISRANSPGLHKALKELGRKSGDTDKVNFNLDAHKGLTDKEIADDLGE